MMPIFVHQANVAPWAENPSLFGLSHKSNLQNLDNLSWQPGYQTPVSVFKAHCNNSQQHYYWITQICQYQK
jgi:hypothetical protein